MKNRLSLLELHNTEIKTNMMSKVKGGVDIRCLCTTTNPLISTRETGGSAVLCLCNSATLSKSVQDKPSSN